jgi:uncharacterized protein
MPLAGVISDTHGLLRPQALAALAGVALIIHAGDIGSQEVLQELHRLAPTYAVRGNVDHHRWAATLPRSRIVAVGEVSLYVLHDLAALDLDPTAAGLQAVIYGHSHQPGIKEENGVLYLNPGSAGPRRFHLPVTVARLHIEDGSLQPEIIHLPLA